MSGLLYRHPHPLHRARFVRRPHRFSAICTLETSGLEVESHLADPGRLTQLLTPGAPILLAGPFGPPRKLAWSAVMVEAEGGVFVNLITALPNQLFEPLLMGGHLPELTIPERVVAIEREVRIGRSRLDFRVIDDEGACLVEVKSVTLRDDDGSGRFPDAPSRRARKHLEELIEVASRGERAAAVFVTGRGDLARIAPARGVDPAFAELLSEAEDVGVLLLGIRLAFDLEGARDPRSIEVSPRL